MNVLKNFRSKKVAFFGKQISATVLAMLALAGLASAGLLNYYGMITGTATVSQSVLLDGKDISGMPIIYIYNGVAGSSHIGGPHRLKNNADVPAKIKFETTCCNSTTGQCGYGSGEACEGITTATELQLTTGNKYKRNPSLVKDGSTWYLFYAQDTNSAQDGKGCDDGSLNCDADKYEIYVIKSTDSGKTWGSPVKVSQTITDFNQRDVSGVLAGSTLYAFVSSGSGSKPIYYYTSTDGGTTWNGPTQISTSNPTNVGHFDAVYFNNKIWLFYGESDGLAIRNSGDWGTEYKATMSELTHSKVLKAMVDGNNVTVVWEKSGNGIWYTTSSTPATPGSWTTPKEIAKSGVSGYGDYDPVLYKDSSNKYWLFWAPYNGNVGTPAPQWLEYKTSTTKDGLATENSYKFTIPNSTYVWWDFWPEVTEDANGIVVFYTSESSPTGTRVNGNIWMSNFGDSIDTLSAGDKVGLYIFNGFAINLQPDTYTITTQIKPV